MNPLFWGLPAVGVNAKEEGGCVDINKEDKDNDEEEGKEGTEREEGVGEMVEAAVVGMPLLGRPASTNAEAGTLCIPVF